MDKISHNLIWIDKDGKIHEQCATCSSECCSHTDFYRLQHERIKEIVQNWSDYGNSFYKKFKEVCHENNKLRKENERLRSGGHE